MKSIHTKLVFVISAIMIVVIGTFLLDVISRTDSILDDDSQEILSTVAEYYAGIIDDNFRSTEQSVHTIYNYAIQRAESYTAFRYDDTELDGYTYDISELGKSIAENTPSAMSVYMRYNPYDFDPTSGFWYTYDTDSADWVATVPTDYSQYDPDDAEHVGWYYIPVRAGVPLWMDPYFNANIRVYMVSYIIPFFLDDYTVGIIGMDISMELLMQEVSEVSVYETGRAFLIDRSGNVIYHEAHPDGSAFGDLSEEDRQYFTRALAQAPDEPCVVWGMDGKQQKLILKELENGMILGIYAPLREINQPQRTLLTNEATMSVMILVVAILIGLVWVRTITLPLKKMTSVAEHYAGGDFSEEMSVESEDEVGILSRSLQTMSNSLQEQIRLADAANKAKSDFLANMSHEIRTPINAVLGMNEMILHETQEDSTREYAASIHTAGKTLLSLINSILDFSKIEDGKMEIIPVDYDTASVVNNLVHSVLERAKAKGLDFIADIDRNLPAILGGDDVRITQVVTNLLTNAVKYTEAGSVTFTVREEGRSGDDIDIFFSVKDTGIGIKKEDMGRLFESFERIEEKRNRSIEGTGLGMTIVNRLLPMMGSRLKVHSVYGEGSEFSFTLRQKIVDERPIGDYSARLRSSAAREAEETALRAVGARILVVDDNEMNLKVAANLLKLNGIVPDLADSGQAAIEHIRRQDYDIVFLDHMMPKMDGIETLQNLRKEGLPRPGTRVIALTANAIVGAKETYLAAGFDDYLSKPIELGKLEAILMKYLPAEKITLAAREAAKAAAPAQSGDGDFAALRSAGIDPAAGLRYCQNDAAFYRSILQEFAGSAEEKARSIREFFDASDWKNYAICVHALKSTSKTVGAKALSETAARLEAAAGRGDGAAVRAEHEPMLDAYLALAGAIRAAAPEAAAPAGDDADALEFALAGDDVLEFMPEDR